MKGNFHVRFLGEGVAAMPLPYPTKQLPVTPVKKARHKMSAAGRARISAAAKARWKKAKAAGKSRL